MLPFSNIVNGCIDWGLGVAVIVELVEELLVLTIFLDPFDDAHTLSTYDSAGDIFIFTVATQDKQILVRDGSE